MKRKLKHIVFLLFVSSFFTFCFGQQNDKENELKVNESLYEEVQRYIGYEDLMYRYTSVPYDVNINMNLNGYFVEIGYLLLMFIPILLLILLRNKSFYFYGFMFCLLMMLIVSVGNGVVLGPTGERVNNDPESIQQFLAQGQNASTNLTAQIYGIVKKLYKPFESLSNSISGNFDHVSYPFMFILFLLGVFLVYRASDKLPKIDRYLSLFLMLYGFLWAMFSGGIIWYGFLVLPLGLILIFRHFLSKKEKNKSIRLFKQITFGFALSVWLLLCYVARISNIQIIHDGAGKNLIDQPTLYHLAGIIDESQVYDSYFNNLSSALAQINAEDESLIYRVGTMFPLLIENNDTRLYTDTLLKLFKTIQNKHNSKESITTILKNAGFKYILLGLNIPAEDKTPEKSLTKKFNEFTQILYDNPQIQLLATNRIINKSNDPNNPVLEYNVFGKVYAYGNYAIFAIK